MRWAVASTVGLLLSGCLTPAQITATNQEVASGLVACKDQTAGGKTAVDVIICENGVLTRGYEKLNYPYMDLVYDLELKSLNAASKVDSGGMSVDDFAAFKAAAALEMRSEESRRQQEKAAQNAQLWAQASRELAASEQAALQAQVQGFHNAVQRASAVNCTTSYVGTQAYTHCY